MTDFHVFWGNINGEDALIFKPVEVLSDSEYDSWKTCFEAMNVHWRELVGGFVFYPHLFKPDSEQLQREKMQFFPTPKSLVHEMIRKSGLNSVKSGCSILEPSAGVGNIIKELPGHLISSVVAVEPDDRHLASLRRACGHIYHMTFESYYEIAQREGFTYTHVLMNPPFGGVLCARHVQMAYNLLRKGGRLVAIISENSLYYNNKENLRFLDWLEEVHAEIEHNPSGAFKESGSMIDTMMIVIDKE